MIRESECSGKLLYERARAIIADDGLLDAMGEGQKKLGTADASARIAKEILSLIHR